MAPQRHDILQTFVFAYIEHVMGGSQVCVPPNKCTHYNLRLCSFRIAMTDRSLCYELRQVKCFFFVFLTYIYRTYRGKRKATYI